MGTKVEIENYYFLGQSSMRDLSRDSNGGGWPSSCYTDGSLPNGQFHYGFLARSIADSHPEYDKDVLKQKMLEHEAIFKDQVYELHRLYRVQRGLMDEVRRKEPYKRGIMPFEASSSSSPMPSQMQLDGAQRWNNGSSFPLSRPFISGQDTVQSSPNSVKGKSILAGPNPNPSPTQTQTQTQTPSPYHNSYSPKTSEASEARPTKLRKRILDLQLPADEYIDTDEVDQFGSAKELVVHISKRKALADLNEPLHVEETTTFSSFGILGHANFLDSSMDSRLNSKKTSINGTSNNLHERRVNGQDWSCYAFESEQRKVSAKAVNQEFHREKAPVASRRVQSSTSEHIKTEPWKPNNSNYHIPGSHVSSQPGLFWGNSTPIQSSLFQTSVHKDEIFGKWDPNSSRGGSDKSLGIEPPTRNGFIQVPARFPETGFDYVNCDYSENVKPVRDMNLNEALPSNGVSADITVDEDSKTAEDPLTVLPWLRQKSDPEVGKPLKEKDPMDNSHHRSRYEEVVGFGKRKPVFDMNLPCDETSDEEVVVIEKLKSKSPSFRNHFDLNSCVTEEVVCTGIDLEALINLANEEEEEDEIQILPVVDSPTKESETENLPPEEDAESAASAIVAMSSSCVKSKSKSTRQSTEGTTCLSCLPPEAEGDDDPLDWFVSIACSTGTHGLDEFEYMNSRIKELTLDEYFPKPSVPDFSTLENTGTSALASKTRKGQGRRGRQRRDFQRDILPGLTTLSRHEVTEDLQTFGGLMRAMGHSWSSGPNRRNAARNGRGRGRRRFVETIIEEEEVEVGPTPVCGPPTTTRTTVKEREVSVVDRRSLTGWGKTTRRPRRQRCPPAGGNLTVVQVRP